MSKLDAAKLRAMLDYSPETGEFRWRVNRGGGARAGSLAGCINSRGYRYICIDRVVYLAARLAWLHMTGEWPKDTVDHKNCERADNRWANLREATCREQHANKRKRRDAALNRDLGKGVRRSGKMYTAAILDEYLGIYPTAEEASAAYLARAKELYGEFARA